jgi:hypothetical protein
MRSTRLTALVALVSLGALALASVAGGAGVRADAGVRVTVFGDSVATAMEYDPTAKRVLARGIDLQLETVACRRLGDTSCPYDGVRPSNVVDRATQLGTALGPVVVVVVGYNDYEENYAKNIDDAMAAFRKGGVQRVLWATLFEERQSWAEMNGMIAAAARKYPEITILDWNGLAKQNPSWIQPDGSPHLTPSGAEGMAAMIENSLIQLGIAPKVQPPKPRPRLAIASRSLPKGRLHHRYLARLRASGGTAPYRWTRTGGRLAPGLRLATDGRLHGVPTRAGTYRIGVRVVDESGTALRRVLSVRVR